MLAEHKNVHKHVRESVISIACSINPKMFTSMFKGRASMLDDPKMLTNMGYSQVSMLDEHKNMLANIFWVHRACSSDPRIFLRSSNMLANIFWSRSCLPDVWYRMMFANIFKKSIKYYFELFIRIQWSICYENEMRIQLLSYTETKIKRTYKYILI